MDDLNELHRLAPAVDTDAARVAFRRRRRRSRSLRRGAVAAAAVVVLVAGTVAVALFADSDLVLYGELTGGFVQGDPDFPGSYVGYEVEVRAVYKSPESVPLTDPLFINVAYNSAYDATRYEDAVVAGAPVVVFAHALSIRPGYSASIEGFATACPGDPPIGLVGSTDEWTSLTSLDDLVARLEVAANH